MSVAKSHCPSGEFLMETARMRAQDGAMNDANFVGAPEPPASRPALRRSIDDRYLAGVAGGTAEWLGVDPTIVRIVFVLLTIVGAIGVPLYLAAWLFVPERGSDHSIADRVLTGARSEPVRHRTVSASSWSPWRGGSDPKMRVSDAERHEVVDMLSKHYGDGRLDSQEFEERMAKAMSAKTRADLDGLFFDLPSLGAPAPAPAARRPLRPLVWGAALVLGFFSITSMVALAPAHHAWWLALLVLLVLGRARRRRMWRRF